MFTIQRSSDSRHIDRNAHVGASPRMKVLVDFPPLRKQVTLDEFLDMECAYDLLRLNQYSDLVPKQIMTSVYTGIHGDCLVFSDFSNS